MSEQFLSNKAATNDLAQNGCAYLGEGVTFKGSITVPEKVIVHGTLEGDVVSRELVIGVKGMVKGNVRVDQADVHGKIVERAEIKTCLIVRKTSRVEGALSYGELEIERGGIVAGELAVADHGAAAHGDVHADAGKEHGHRSRPKVVVLESP